MELVLVAYVCAALAVWALLWLRRQSSRHVQLVNRIPGPVAVPFLGTAYSVINVSRSDIFRVRDEETKKYWPIHRTWIGSQAEIHLCDAEDLEVILTSTVNLTKSPFYKFLFPWLGTGLLTSKGQKWHTRRKLITPTFHFKILDGFVNIFAEKSDILVKKLEKEIGNTNGFDVYPYITLCALDIICESAMGSEVNAQDNSQSPYVTAVYDIAELTTVRTMKPWLHNNLIFSLFAEGRRYKRGLNILHEFTKKVIRERKEKFMNKSTTDETEDDTFGKKKRLAFLDLLLEASEGGTALTEEDIREEVDTFMFEGHDTTSASLCWTLFLLGSHLDIQERVYEELDGIFQGSDRPATMKDLAEMKYLERVIKESLRIYPSVPFIGREISEDVEVGGYTLPKGCHVKIHIYHVHRNPKYFPNPDVFDPDNFLPERAQGRHPFAYVPFSAGSRNCIGQKFALLEEKSILSTIIRKYRLRSLEKKEDVTLLAELVLRPERGIRMTLEKRT